MEHTRRHARYMLGAHEQCCSNMWEGGGRRKKIAPTLKGNLSGPEGPWPAISLPLHHSLPLFLLVILPFLPLSQVNTRQRGRNPSSPFPPPPAPPEWMDGIK